MPQTLNEWVKRAEFDAGVREGVTTSEAQRMKELEREVRELRKAMSSKSARMDTMLAASGQQFKVSWPDAYAASSAAKSEAASRGSFALTGLQHSQPLLLSLRTVRVKASDGRRSPCS